MENIDHKTVIEEWMPSKEKLDRHRLKNGPVVKPKRLGDIKPVSTEEERTTLLSLSSKEQMDMFRAWQTEVLRGVREEMS